MKIRIEIEDEGTRSSFEFESKGVERSSIRERVVDFLNASGVFSDPEVPAASQSKLETGGTLMDKLRYFIEYEFPDSWFTTQSLRERYETVCEDIKLSTVSTYLSRMNRDGILDRRGNRNNREYRLMETERREPLPPRLSSKTQG
ncbi:MAG: hypothetical protein GKC10_06965 [Methanosarcinales archaeon]|nr:hypothetical protein [Methanosarcinales archaeon]